MYINERENISYHEFLRTLREKYGLSQKQVCKGICTVSGMNRFEKGNRIAEKLMRDRLTARLGISCERYEDYLQTKECLRWEQRKDIINAIENRELEKAKERVETYALFEKSNCVNLQFVGAMRHMILKLEDAPRKEQLEVLQNAILYTVPNVKKAVAGGYLLCDQEVNLIAEMISLESPEIRGVNVHAWRIAQYEKLISYIGNSHWEDKQKAKIYPKMVYHICISMMKKELTRVELKRGIQLCREAIRLLQMTKSRHYFKELTKACQKWEALLKRSDRDVQSNTILQEITDYCYLYYENECYDMAKVIEIRRKMLRMSRRKLAEGICTERTVVRFEREGNNPSVDMVREMFEKMGLCAEYRRANVATNDVDVLFLADKVVCSQRVGDYNGWEKNLKKLEKRLCMEIPLNKQVVKSLVAMLLYKRGEIEKEEFSRRMKDALEYTLPMAALEGKGEKYLTKMEKAIIGLFEMENNEKTYL